MEYSKCQETSNPLSLGLESKDSRSWDGKTDLEDDFVQLVVDPEEVSQAYVEQQCMDGYDHILSHAHKQKLAFDRKLPSRALKEVIFKAGQLVRSIGAI